MTVLGVCPKAGVPGSKANPEIVKIDNKMEANSLAVLRNFILVLRALIIAATLSHTLVRSLRIARDPHFCATKVAGHRAMTWHEHLVCFWEYQTNYRK